MIPLDLTLLRRRAPAPTLPRARRQGDACNLPRVEEAFGPFDAILASNLLCRLPKPQEFLSSLPRLLKPRGIVVMVSPYSWLVEYTARSEWMGGCIRDGDTVNSAETVKQAMARAPGPGALGGSHEAAHRGVLLSCATAEDARFKLRDSSPARCLPARSS